MEQIPQFSGRLRKNIVTVPDIIGQCSGIKVFGQILKSFLFSTDVTIIRNTNADAEIEQFSLTAKLFPF